MKLIDNATDIRIPKDTIVIMAGVQGAGKTFLLINILIKKILFVMMKFFGRNSKSQEKKI